MATKARDDLTDIESTQLNRQDDAAKWRVLRSKYLAVMNKTNDARDEISRQLFWIETYERCTPVKGGRENTISFIKGL